MSTLGNCGPGACNIVPIGPVVGTVDMLPQYVHARDTILKHSISIEPQPFLNIKMTILVVVASSILWSMTQYSYVYK